MSDYAGCYDLPSQPAMPAVILAPYWNDDMLQDEDTHLDFLSNVGPLLNVMDGGVGQGALSSGAETGDAVHASGIVSQFVSWSEVQGFDDSNTPKDFSAPDYGIKELCRPASIKKRKMGARLKALSVSELFPVVCPNLNCLNDDKSTLESLKGCGGSRQGFLCPCGERWSQRVKRQDEATDAFGTEDRLIKESSKRSQREIDSGIPPLPKVKQVNFIPEQTAATALYDFDGTALGGADKHYLSFAAGDQIFIKAAECNDEWSMGKLKDGPYGYFPTFYVRKGTCQRNARCIKHAGHKGMCKIGKEVVAIALATVAAEHEEDTAFASACFA